jgi:hypothetical protein
VVCALQFNTTAAAAAATEFANFATQKLCSREQEDLGQQPSSSFTVKAAAHSGSVTLCTLAQQQQQHVVETSSEIISNTTRSCLGDQTKSTYDETQ